MPAAIAEIPKPAPTPAPAPAPTPAPAPIPDPSAAPGATSDQAFDDKFSHLDDAPEIPVKPAPVAKPETPPATKPAPAAAKPAAKPEAPESFDPPQTTKPGDLRGWALTMGKKAKAAVEEATTLKNRIKELESKPAPQDSGQTKMLAEQLAAANKRLEEYESELRLTRYDRSSEYKEKFERPYNSALERAYRDVQELLVATPNPNDPDNPNERQGTKSDFDEIFKLPLGPATKLAKQKFGDSAVLVLQHAQRLRELSESAWQATEDYKTKGAEREKETEARTRQEQAFMASAWDKMNAGFKSKSPELFDERPDDPEGNAALKEGMDFADLAFNQSALEKYPLPQQIAIHARVRNWAGAFPRLRRDLRAAALQLAEANATIEQLRGSDPGKPTPSGEEVPAGGQTLDDAFEAKFGR